MRFSASSSRIYVFMIVALPEPAAEFRPAFGFDAADIAGRSQRFERANDIAQPDAGAHKGRPYGRRLRRGDSRGRLFRIAIRRHKDAVQMI